MRTLQKDGVEIMSDITIEDFTPKPIELRHCVVWPSDHFKLNVYSVPKSDGADGEGFPDDICFQMVKIVENQEELEEGNLEISASIAYEMMRGVMKSLGGKSKLSRAIFALRAALK